MSNNNIIISLKEVNKSFGRHNVLDHISLDIEKGTAYTFVGHNGMGKSTLLKIIAKLITINSGTVTYNSANNPMNTDHKISVSYIPEQFPRYNITAMEYLTLMAGIAGLDEKAAELQSDILLEKFYMSSMKDTKLLHLSKGSLQKVSVIQALLTTPDVILLDEPISGQDISSQNVFINMINELKSKGMTVIMSCHEKFLINRISDVIYEIKDGHLLPVDKNTIEISDYDILTIDLSNYSKPTDDNSEINLHTINNRLRSDNLSAPIPDSLFGPIYSPHIHNVTKLNHSSKLIIKLTIDSDYSNSLILMLLKNGAVLREMQHESI